MQDPAPAGHEGTETSPPARRLARPPPHPSPKENPLIKNMHPARLMAAAEALVACVAAFLPLSGEQVATLLGVVAVLTGERVVRKVAKS